MTSPHPTRRQFLSASAASAASLSFPAFAAGDIGGGKAVTLVVSYPAGGGADAMARLIAPKLAEALGQPVIVDNKPGGSGTIAAGQVARAAPDGTTLLLDASSFAVNPALFQKLPYDNEKSFVPIAVLAQFPNVLVCTPSFEARTVADVLRLARAKPDTLAYASSGNGSAQHLAGALFEQLAKVDLTHVPYRGGGPAMNDVMGGQVPVFFANVASGLGHVKGGKLRAMALTGSKRIAALPDLPTMAEAGVPGYEVYEWNGIFAPAGTPAPVIAKLAEAVQKAMASPEIRERVATLGGEIAPQGPKEAEKFIREQAEMWARVVKAGNIKVD